MNFSEGRQAGCGRTPLNPPLKNESGSAASAKAYCYRDKDNLQQQHQTNSLANNDINSSF